MLFPTFAPKLPCESPLHIIMNINKLRTSLNIRLWVQCKAQSTISILTQFILAILKELLLPALKSPAPIHLLSQKPLLF